MTDQTQRYTGTEEQCRRQSTRHRPDQHDQCQQEDEEWMDDGALPKIAHGETSKIDRRHYTG